MTKPSRLAELANAVSEYGETSLRLHHQVRELGDRIVAAMPSVLGGDALVFGVPPDGEWTPNEHLDGKFSSFGRGLMVIEPVDMGLAVRVPHLWDDGHTWLRTVVEIRPEGGDLVVGPKGANQSVRIGAGFSSADVERVCALIHDELVAFLRRPVSEATGEGGLQIGFLSERT